MADKKAAQKAAELRLQQLQDELDTREVFLQAQEKKFAILQARADDFIRREDMLRVREERAAQIELRVEELKKVEDELAARQATIAEDAEAIRRREEVFRFRLDEFSRECSLRSDEFAQRTVLLDLREKKLVQWHDQEQAAQADRRRLADEREQDLRQLERELKLRRVQLSEEHSQLQRQVLDVRNKEEEHEQFEKLIKDMQTVDERSRKQIKWMEDDLQRRALELRVAREDFYAESTSLEALREKLEQDKAAIEVKLKQSAAQVASADKITAHLQQWNAQLDDRERACGEWKARLEAEKLSLAQKDADLAALREQLVHIQREASIDVKRATHVRQKSGAQQQNNAKVLKKLQARETELSNWDDELDWREAEFARSSEAAMNVTHETPSFAPGFVNRAIVNLQVERMRTQYNAAQQRRAISALQPKNRARSAQSGRQRTHSPIREEPADVSPASEDASFTQRVLSASHSLAVQTEVERLERDFRFYIGHVMQMQQAAPSEEAKDELMAKYFAPAERVAVQYALQRERDLGAEFCFRQLVKQSPLDQATANPVESMQRAQRWWHDMKNHIAAREEATLQERMNELGEAVRVLRKRCPQFTQSDRLKRGARAQSAQPRGKGDPL